MEDEASVVRGRFWWEGLRISAGGEGFLVFAGGCVEVVAAEVV